MNPDIQAVWSEIRKMILGPWGLPLFLWAAGWLAIPAMIRVRPKPTHPPESGLKQPDRPPVLKRPGEPGLMVIEGTVRHIEPFLDRDGQGWRGVLGYAGQEQEVVFKIPARADLVDNMSAGQQVRFVGTRKPDGTVIVEHIMSRPRG